MGYSTVILMIYLLLKKSGFIDGPEFATSELFFEWINILFLGVGVPLQGTLWFVPMLLLYTGMFCALIYWGKRIFYNPLVILAICVVIGFIGIWITNKGTDLKYFLNISMEMLPVCVCYYLCRNKYPDIYKLLMIPI